PRHRGRDDECAAPPPGLARARRGARCRDRAVRVLRHRPRPLGAGARRAAAREPPLPLPVLRGGTLAPSRRAAASRRDRVALPADARAPRRAARGSGRRPARRRLGRPRRVRRLLRCARGVGVSARRGTPVPVRKRSERTRPVDFPSAMWELIFMMLILKIPIVWLGWVVWWSV